MNSLPRGVWQYAFLLIFLFAIVSIVAWTTLNDLQNLAGVSEEEVLAGIEAVSFKVLALTMGFMFMSGALGLWLIRGVAQHESELRIGQVVDGMDYLNDGLLSLDKKGRITGSNPSARRMMTPGGFRHGQLTSAFPCLSPSDATTLLDLKGPNEVQVDLAAPEGRRALRFRSQTSGGTCLVLVSDVTKLRSDELRRQQIARLELIGRVARGMALDFSAILGNISGHASLFSRLKPGSAEMKASAEAIIRESGRGSQLANHLLDFSHIRSAGKASDALADDLQKAGDLLRVGLARGWSVDLKVGGPLPVVALSSQETQQVVLNLGMVAADAMDQPGVLRVSAGVPSDEKLFKVGTKYAAVVVVSALPAQSPATEIETGSALPSAAGDAGAIQSVVRSIVEESGGVLDVFTGPGRSKTFRVAIPPGTIESQASGGESADDRGLRQEIRAYVANWRVLLARSNKGHDFLEETLRKAGTNVERVSSVVSVLSRIESQTSLDAVVVEKGLLGDEANGLVRAMVKLCPSTGVVVLCDDPVQESAELGKDVVFERRRSGPVAVIEAMIEARGMAVRRQSA